MPTTAQSEQLLKMFNIFMYGVMSGLWDMFDESAVAAIGSTGAEMLELVEKANAVKIEGADAAEVLRNVPDLLVNKVGSMTNGEVTVEGNKASIACENCALQESTAMFEAQGIPPFACLPLNIGAAALKREFGLKHRLLGRDWDESAQTCTINFELVK